MVGTVRAVEKWTLVDYLDKAYFKKINHVSSEVSFFLSMTETNKMCQ